MAVGALLGAGASLASLFGGKKQSGGMSPELISGLFGLGGSLLSGFGSAAAQKRKWGDFMKRMDMLKPQGQYYGVEQNLPQIDPMIQKIVMGMLGERGINMGNLGFLSEIPPVQINKTLGKILAGDYTIDSRLMLHIEVLRAFGQGDMVCDEHITSGTHDGPLKSSDGSTIPPSGKRFSVRNCHIYKIKEGKVVETWRYLDQLVFLTQLDRITKV